jgi:mono/diheme cytochrome c family protein
VLLLAFKSGYMYRRIICIAFLLVSAWVLRHPQRSAAVQSVDFSRDIQPIFQAHCTGCHGAQKASSQLRLDVKSLAMKGGTGGAVILPGNSRQSRLMQRLLGEGGEQRMPLKGEPLKPQQIELIRRWIDEGATWVESEAERRTPNPELPKHWAFVKPQRPVIPQTKNKTWVRNPIDYFVLAAIEKAGLTPSPEADKTTLLRRLSLDLTGLPPTPKEVDSFLADTSANAYEKQVERLLSSPHYGERWGRWWLDAARYADSNGFEKDRARSIWPYRDWVIQAFNQDKPFDEFTIEQLAGDLLPDATLDQRVATGFLRNSMQNEEGGVDPEQFRVEGLIDRVDAVGKAFLGLTVNCAQCHNHKFDPIRQTEYYQFYAFLNSDDEPEIEVPDEKINRKRAEILSGISRIEEELIAGTPDLNDRLRKWEAASAYPTRWEVLKDGKIFAAFGVKFDNLEDGSFLAKGDNATANNYKINVETKRTGITGFRVELLTDPNLPRSGPGRAADGSMYISEFIVESGAPGQAEPKDAVALSQATADFALENYPVSNLMDGNQKTHWSSDAGPGRRNQNRKIVFAAKSPVNYPGGTSLKFQISSRFDENIAWGKPNIGRFRLSVTTDANPQADPLPASVRNILAIPREQRTAQQQREIFSYYRTTVSEWAEANRKIDGLMKDWPYGPTTLALAQRPQLRETHLFRRGDWKRPGESVTPGTPALMHAFPADAPRNRLGLAKWIVDADNPLTARVIVNRVWQQYFGMGFVTSPEDFGMRCDSPSHPELLDWLAVAFRDGTAPVMKSEHGMMDIKTHSAQTRHHPSSTIHRWHMKDLHRLIVTSAAYRQSSKVTPLLLEKDPTNKLLARASRLRVEAEAIRDIALSASGLLSHRIGGPSVYPPIPDGVLNLGYGAPMPWPTSTGEDRYRRGMYTFWKRAVPYPGALIFDQPNGDFSCTRRVRSNTPLQALTTLNDTTYMEAAQALALRVYREGGATDREKMMYAFRLCTGRKPDAVELSKLMVLLGEQQQRFAGHTASAVYVAAADLNKIPEDVDLHKVAPWTMVARVLLNLDETITKE